MARESGRRVLYLRGMPDELVREAKALAARQDISLGELVTRALRAFVTRGEGRDAQVRALEADMAWYGVNEPKLLRRHEGEYLAIVDREVVDQDAEFARLAERVAKRYGTRPVFMPRCQAAGRVARVASPRVVR